MHGTSLRPVARVRDRRDTLAGSSPREPGTATGLWACGASWARASEHCELSPKLRPKLHRVTERLVEMAVEDLQRGRGQVGEAGRGARLGRQQHDSGDEKGEGAEPTKTRKAS